MSFLTAETSILAHYTPYQGMMLIDGELCHSVTGKRVDRIGPAHGIVVANYPEGSKEDAGLAISAAHRALDKEWATLTASERAKLLLKVAEGIAARVDEMAMIECLETGKPLSQAHGEVSGCVDLWRYAASLARTLHGESYNNLGDSMLGVVVRQPVGVVTMITPWNFPIWILSQKLPFALAAGCTVVIKPSEFTNGTTLMLGEILIEAGLPRGVVNIVTGLGEEVGAPLSTHELVDMVSFTGSTRVGTLIAAEAGRRLKKVSLELGGKNPQIIFPDCDWDAAVDAVVFGVYFNAGECCNSGSRILVHKDIADKFTRAVVEKSRLVRVGDPLNPEVKIGAIINENQMITIEKAIQSARDQGAEILLGGERIPSRQGLFLEPTIVGNVTPGMDIAREEVFGPVLSILTFEDKDQAIKIANDTCYGLSASVWSKDIDICLEAARKIKAGTVWVNTFLDGSPELPFGGFNQSGLGRELGRHAVEDYTEQKTIQLHIGERTNWWLAKS
ncbi:aldehyde dehydrogenase family protein [Erwinia tasmaniensis]|uniref:L-sorbosone dehydrogenase, NAD(P) dependent n=1 Tax=Erwinia tasmaniensis (strain DSM 17950 / CFBP 7177 / CIP 109463 / NCPPB 4357 / Et1/99) TaxID=465817 RepID=B2VIK9_ERWT9|nr:aldehyde dehydrogenase family protein [Erwinia tasmaniensis]CAO96296.1 L-sorbosone dehydrogenase, NAD(P) dependent [Erwinia tasmaniensis Et1/99]